MEAVFRALGDPNRRRLLDRLFDRDGQTLAELCAGQEMTRFGVMKHLRVLEDASLVVSRRSGREKRHYLNPVPIRLIHDRWISKYAEPWTGAMSTLKTALEEQPMTAPPTTAPSHVYVVYIKTTPERLWQALTDGQITRQYFFGTTVESDWKPGSPFRFVGGDGRVPVWGTVLEAEPPRRLVHTFEHSFSDGEVSEVPTRVAWEIEQVGNACKLTVLHEGFTSIDRTYESTGNGWPMILSGLKTLLETGEPLAVA